MGKDIDVSVLGPTGLGLHLTINPRKSPKAKRDIHGKMKLPQNTEVGEIYKRHGLRLTTKELNALKISRTLGVQAIDSLLSRTSRTQVRLSPDQRLNLAMKAADFLLEKSLEAQLSREVPTALNREEQTAEKLEAMIKNMNAQDAKKGSAPSLIEAVPFGVSLTVHLPVDWL